MSRIHKVFEQAKRPLLNIYFTAGYPDKESTVPVLNALQEAGTDLIEIGMPYSDPLADGLTIQESSGVALKNGMSIDVLFQQLKDIRKSIEVPLILMGYLNPVMQYGEKKFCQKCAEVGIDGLILPDLPLEMFETEYGDLFRQYGLDFTFLITPETSKERIRKIDQLSTGFIYMVSSSATTGKAATFSDEQIAYFKRIQEMQLNSPRLIGFGIGSKASFDQASEYGQGAIVGSAFIKQLKKDASKSSITNFVKSIKP